MPTVVTDHAAEWRAKATDLRADILASRHSLKAVGIEAGLTTRSQREWAFRVLRGEDTSRPVVEKMQAAFERLTQNTPKP